MNRKQLLGTGLAWAFALACLAWVFHDLDAGQVWSQFKELDWRWIPAALLFDFLSYSSQAVRWRLLLADHSGVDLRLTLRAVYSGLFVSEALPGRLGEVARGIVVRIEGGVPVAAVLVSIVIERFFDGLWLVLGLLAIGSRVPLPKSWIEGGDALVLLLAGAAAIAMGIIVFARGQLRERTTRLTQRLRVSVKSPGFAAAFFVSALIPTLEGVALWFLMKSCGIHRGVEVGIAVGFLLRLGIALPGAPGNIGTFQAACVLSMTLFGVEKPEAAAFSLVAFVILSLPLWGLGWVAIRTSGIDFQSLRRELVRAREKSSAGT